MRETNQTRYWKYANSAFCTLRTKSAIAHFAYLQLGRILITRWCNWFGSGLLRETGRRDGSVPWDSMTSLSKPWTHRQLGICTVQFTYLLYNAGAANSHFEVCFLTNYRAARRTNKLRRLIKKVMTSVDGSCRFSNKIGVTTNVFGVWRSFKII